MAATAAAAAAPRATSARCCGAGARGLRRSGRAERAERRVQPQARGGRGGDGGGLGDAAKSPVGGAVSGAVLGGLIAGPFGAIWGAQIGSSLGAGAQLEREQRDELAKVGLTPELLQEFQELAEDLSEAEGSLNVLREAEDRERERVDRGRQLTQDLYAEAEAAMGDGDEDQARRLLVERKRRQQDLDDDEKALEEAIRRVERASAAVDSLAARAASLERIIEGGAANAAELKAQARNPSGGALDVPQSFDDLEREFYKK